uniref:ATP-citrate synthase ATP-grasp domain-containing protein n=1 Tax=Aegilops tauschii subsp. strangulata TaxID=200361 RepID=A0A453JXU7_AEGTS
NTTTTGQRPRSHLPSTKLEQPVKSRAAYIYPVLGATRAPSSGAPVLQTTGTTASTYPSSASRSVGEAMARKKIREYDSKRLLKEHLKRLAGIDLQILSAQVTQSTDFTELSNQEPWLSSMKLVVKPDMLFGKRGKSGLVALNLDLAQVRQFVKERLGVEVEMGGCKAPITTFIVEPFVPHDQEYYLSIMSDRLGCTISFSECGGIEIEENWDKVKTIFLPTEKPMTLDACAPLIATLPLEVRTKIGDFIRGSFSVFQDLDFSFMEMNPFTLVNGEPYPLDMRGELDDTAAFKNFKKWGDIEFPLPFGRVLSPSESYIHELDEKV